MANYYLDTHEYRHHMQHPLMRRIVELKERGFEEMDTVDYAPQDYVDAMDSYDKVLEIVGEICAEIIQPNAEEVDHEGPTVSHGRVTYAEGTKRNLDAVRKAGLSGIAMPRRYGGLNFPIVPYIMVADMVSRADAGFENLWGLQDCAETLYEFGNEDQRQRFIPRVCGGETMSMDLTEPDAGSDLQAVMLRATYSEKEGCWLLNGVKRFITNGDSDIHLVLARSEEGTKDGRGLSMFIYDKRDGGVNVRRIENKMGIKGSPTCELVYKNARAELCGERRLGLIKYVMALMNGARLGIIAQSVGLSEAAYREAYAYALGRVQFGKPIIEFPPVYEMLTLMRAKTDASRAMLYETARFVDISKSLEDISRERKLTPEEKIELKKYSKLADAFTPLGKGITSEYANQNAYDAIQIHGGSGFMKDYACERIYRDARITSIYEGTTQLQVVAAIRYVTNGFYLEVLREYEDLPCEGIKCLTLLVFLKDMTDSYELLVNKVTETKDNEYITFHSRRLMEAAAHCIFGHLLLQDANRDERFYASAATYIAYGQAEVDRIHSFISKGKGITNGLRVYQGGGSYPDGEGSRQCP
jgi:alkylation response protein AidB-like acyl-CoA dehydrogenase